MIEMGAVQRPLNELEDPNLMTRTYIVLLNWNSKEMTAECIRSLFAMRERDFRIIVVDNGSRDDSVTYLGQMFPEILVIANQKNLGFTGGCNVGIARALEQGTEFILLVNNDVVLDENLLGELLADAERNPKAGMVSPKIYYFDEPKRIWWAGGTYNPWVGLPRVLGLRRPDSDRYGAPREIDWATGCVLLLRSSALRDAGSFNEEFFSYVEDLDLSLRVRDAGYTIRLAPRAKVWHKVGVYNRKDGAEHTRVFFNTRNLLWLINQRATPMRWLVFWPNFVVRVVPYVIVMSLLQRDSRILTGLFQGVVAFWKMRLPPDSQNSA